jgi:hypothetical protein
VGQAQNSRRFLLVQLPREFCAQSAEGNLGPFPSRTFDLTRKRFEVDEAEKSRSPPKLFARKQRFCHINDHLQEGDQKWLTSYRESYIIRLAD